MTGDEGVGHRQVLWFGRQDVYELGLVDHGDQGCLGVGRTRA